MMMQMAKLYGFGSYFGIGIIKHSDIDLLLVHEDIGQHSTEFAIRLKDLILNVLPSAHVVMLSYREERELQLIDRSRARFLQTISEIAAVEEVQRLGRAIAELRSRSRTRTMPVIAR